MTSKTPRAALAALAGPRCFRAFTLVELLVVVAIIGILAALLFPLGKSMMESGNASKCVANQKKIVIGILQFAIDNGGLPPFNSTPPGASGGYYWYANLSRTTAATLPYCGHLPLRQGESAETIWVCPANSPYKVIGAKSETSYGIPCNSNRDLTIYPDRPYNTSVKLISLPNPSKTVAITEYAVTRQGTGKILTDTDIAKPHRGGANFAFFDGHVEFFKPVPAYTNEMFKRTREY